MQRYVLRKIALTLPVLIAITLAVFLMRVMIPGDPVEMMTLGQHVDQATKDGLRRTLGLDKPLWEQYTNYLKGLTKFDLGMSVRTRQPVSTEILDRYPNTLKLAIASLAVSTTIGVGAGVISALRRNTWLDVGISILTSLTVSIPSFWLGLLLLFQFGVKWRIFPITAGGGLKHLVLPAVTLGLIYSSIVVRMTRSALLEVLRQDYIRTARAKGLSAQIVTYRHALRNAILPVITIIGLQLGGLLGGAFIVESVFVYPGIGQLAVKAIQYRDFPLIQGITLMAAVTAVALNLAVDILYAFFNPQIRYS